MSLPPALYRIRSRSSVRRRAAAIAALVVPALLAAQVGFLAGSGRLSWWAAVPLGVGMLAAGFLTYLGVLGRLSTLLEPSEYRAALGRLEVGDRTSALAYAEIAIARRPDAFSPFTLRGLLLAEAGRFEESLESYREAIARKPQSWIGHSGAGAALLNLGRPIEAIEALGRSLALGARWSVPRYQLGLALFLRGEYAGAAEALGEALALGLEAPTIQLVARSLRVWALEQMGSAETAAVERIAAEPLHDHPEVEAFRARLRGANLSPVGSLAAWAVGVSESPDPPRI